MNGAHGTGKFISQGFDAVVDETNVSIQGRTDFGGLFTAQYEAGSHGVHEQLLTRLKRPATETDSC
jgi:hypothetical protein